MSLASYDDANDHLDGTKLRFTSDNDAEPEAKQIDRLIKASLYGSFGAEVDTWDFEPTPPQIDTPPIVKYIASGLMAAMRWAKQYSMEALDEDSYSSRLESKMMSMLMKIISGELTIDADSVSGLVWKQSDFWPNDTHLVEGTDQPNRRFAMDQAF